MGFFRIDFEDIEIFKNWLNRIKIIILVIGGEWIGYKYLNEKRVELNFKISKCIGFW